MIATLIEQAISLILRLIGIAQAIQFVTNILNGPPSVQPAGSTALLTFNEVGLIESQVTSPLFGLAHIEATIVSNQTALLAAIAACQQTSSPVTLPPTQPPGYGTANAADVWNFIVGTFGGVGFNAAEAVVLPHNMAKNWGDTWTYRFADSPFFTLVGIGYAQPLIPFTGSSPRPLLSSVRRTDTVLSWLQREASFWTWFVGIGGDVRAPDNRLTLTVEWSCVFTDATLQFAAFGTVAGIAGAELAPVWPGIVNVVLGTSLALSNGLTVPGPLDGVIIHVSSVPYPISFYPFGSVKSFVKTGGIIFVDDNGEADIAQPIGIEHQVVCPKTMVRADHAIVRLQSGVVGTIQPWTHI